MKERLSVYLDPHVMRSTLIDYADRPRQNRSRLLPKQRLPRSCPPDAAERQEAALARRLDRLVRQTERLERDVRDRGRELGALSFVFWLTATGRRCRRQTQAAGAAPKGAERYHAFIEALGRRLAKGPTLLRGSVLWM